MPLGSRAEVTVGDRSGEALVVQTFADVPDGQLLLYEDAWQSIALAINRGDAAAELGIGIDDEVRVAPAT